MHLERVSQPRNSLKLLLATLMLVLGAPRQSTHSEAEEPPARVEGTKRLKKPAFVFIDGMRSTPESTERDYGEARKAIEAAGYHFETIDLRTASDAPEAQKRTIEDIVEEVIVAIELVKKNPGIDPERIVVAGMSLGAHMAVRAGSRLGTSAIIADALPTYLDGALSSGEPLSSLFKSERYKKLQRMRSDRRFQDGKLNAALKDFRGHLLCIFRENDTVTPWSIHYRPCKANEESSVLMIPAAEHYLQPDDPRRRELTAFILEWLKNPADPKYKELNILSR